MNLPTDSGRAPRISGCPCHLSGCGHRTFQKLPGKALQLVVSWGSRRKVKAVRGTPTPNTNSDLESRGRVL